MSTKKFGLTVTKHSNNVETWFDASIYVIHPDTGKYVYAPVYSAARYERERAVSACIAGSCIPEVDIEIEAESI